MIYIYIYNFPPGLKDLYSSFDLKCYIKIEFHSMKDLKQLKLDTEHAQPAPVPFIIN